MRLLSMTERLIKSFIQFVFDFLSSVINFKLQAILIYIITIISTYLTNVFSFHCFSKIEKIIFATKLFYIKILIAHVKKWLYYFKSYLFSVCSYKSKKKCLAILRHLTFLLSIPTKAIKNVWRFWDIYYTKTKGKLIKIYSFERFIWNFNIFLVFFHIKACIFFLTGKK